MKISFKTYLLRYKQFKFALDEVKREQNATEIQRSSTAI